MLTALRKEGARDIASAIPLHGASDRAVEELIADGRVERSPDGRAFLAPWSKRREVLLTSTLGLLLGIITVIWSWYAMMIVHELGHVVGAVATGGRVTRVVLELDSFSRTDVDPNPNPMAVVWAGPLAGVLLPMLLWLIVRPVWREGGVLLRFWAGFCLIANGAYIGVGSLERVGDAGDMLRLGSPAWALWVFGAVCGVAGLACWNGLGKWMGVARGGQRASWRMHAASLVMLAVAAGIVAIV